MQMAPTLIPSLLAIAEDIAHYTVAICQQALSIIRHLLAMLASMTSTHQHIAPLIEQQLPACMLRAGTIIAAPISLSVSPCCQVQLLAQSLLLALSLALASQK